MAGARKYAVVAATLFVLTATINFYRAHMSMSDFHLDGEIDSAHHALRKLAGTTMGVSQLSTVQQLQHEEAEASLYHSASLLAIAEYNAALSHNSDLGPDPEPAKTVYDQRDPVSASGDWTDVISHIPVGSVVSVTFTSSGYKGLMTNWVMHHRMLKVPYLVAVFDKEAADYCSSMGISWVWANKELGSANFRKDFQVFRSMGSFKPLLVAALLRRKMFSGVVLSDTDTSWLRDPTELLQLHPRADLMVSTDCLSHEAEAKKVINVNRCGHVPGSIYNIALNTGVLLFRNTTAALVILDKWHKELADANKNTTVYKDGKITGMKLTDQMEFNIIMGEVLAKPIEADYTDPALIKGSAYDTAIMLWVLPVLVAAGGHTYFQQHLSHAHSEVPFVVHSTFQKHGNIAKMNRFREEGIWAESDRSYYDRGWFMTFEMDVKRYIAEEAKRWKIQHGVVMQDHHKHMLAARYQLAMLQEALGLATALNRTLIIPEFTCYCDQDYYTTVLGNCTVLGTDMHIPYACPVDLFLVPDFLEFTNDKYNLFHYRLKSFLANDQVHKRILDSRSKVVLLPPPYTPPELLAVMSAPVRYKYSAEIDLGAPEAHASHVAGPSAVRGGEGIDATAAVMQGQLMFRLPTQYKDAAVLPMHLRDVDVCHALKAVEKVRILDFVNLAPGAFGGFANMSYNREWDERWDYVVGGSGYCCTGGDFDKQWDYVYWRYTLPQRLTHRSRGASDLVQVPFLRPTYCDDLGRLNDQNLKYVKMYKNHPCNYLLRPGL